MRRAIGVSNGATSQLHLTPYPRVRRIRTNLPVEAIELHSFQPVQINALETARLNHVVLGLRARTIEGCDPAVATEVMECSARTELIRCKSLLSLDETESIGRDHVVKVALTPADRAIAFADSCELGSNLELDPTTMA